MLLENGSVADQCRRRRAVGGQSHGHRRISDSRPLSDRGGAPIVSEKAPCDADRRLYFRVNLQAAEGREPREHPAAKES